MCKTLIILIVFFISINTFSQNKQFEFGYTYNFNLYEEHQNYISNSYATFPADKNNMISKSWSSYFTFKTINLNKSSIQFGLTFRNTRLKVFDFQDSITVFSTQYSGIEHISHTVVSKEKLLDPVDLICNSYDIGLVTNYNFSIYSGKKFTGTIGGQLEIYVIQLNTSKYNTDSNKSKNSDSYSDISKTYEAFNKNGTQIHNEMEIILTKPHRFTTVNSSIYYKHTWERNEKSNVSLKLSLGTNIYSCWKQFSKYAWLGLGLEVGIGKTKSQK